MLLLLLTLVPTAALCLLLPGVRHLFYTGARVGTIVLAVAQACLRTLGFMQLAATLCFLIENSLQGAITFVLPSSNATFTLITMTLLTGPLKNNAGHLQPFLYTSMLRSMQADILTGKSFVGTFVLVIGMYMLLLLFPTLSGFRKRELLF